jgi:hypothetical protein
MSVLISHREVSSRERAMGVVRERRVNRALTVDDSAQRAEPFNS